MVAWDSRVQPDLQGGAVFDQPGDELADAGGGFRRRGSHPDAQESPPRARRQMSTSLTWMKLWPSTRGIRGLTWAITRSADIAAARVTSTDIPRLIQPKSSGGVDLDQGHVDRQLLGGEQVRDVGHVHRGDESLVAGDGFGIGRSEVDGADAEGEVLGLIGQLRSGRWSPGSSGARSPGRSACRSIAPAPAPAPGAGRRPSR